MSLIHDVARECSLAIDAAPLSWESVTLVLALLIVSNADAQGITVADAVEQVAAAANLLQQAQSSGS